ncbi:uncharacterized protein LOC121373783 [Gigantopelta aegis]|uniref:uncharacterized protein LOC121373783 n=1 Tax=Gigantopelta aegis TaxID=1735272 RepID=UPI001B88B7AA|nr:uncharacterized protein LOC121373783 [Gigantopelta aegis]
MKIVLILAVLCVLTVPVYSEAKCRKSMAIKCKGISITMTATLAYRNLKVLSRGYMDVKLCRQMVPYISCIKYGCVKVDVKTANQITSFMGACVLREQENKCSKRTECIKAVQVVNKFPVILPNPVGALKLCSAIKQVIECFTEGCQVDKLIERGRLYMTYSYCAKGKIAMAASYSTSVTASSLLMLITVMTLIFQ